MDLDKLCPIEKKRTYHYPDGSKVEFLNVTHFKATQTTHRFRSDGRLIILKDKDWRWIEIEADDFTV